MQRGSVLSQRRQEGRSAAGAVGWRWPEVVRGRARAELRCQLPGTLPVGEPAVARPTGQLGEAGALCDPREGTVTASVNEKDVGGMIPPVADVGDFGGLEMGMKKPVAMVDGKEFIGAKAYKDSKVCCVMLMRELHKRYHESTGIVFSSLYPGCITDTGLFREHYPAFRVFWPLLMKKVVKSYVSNEEAGSRLAKCVADPDYAVSGSYFSWGGESGTGGSGGVDASQNKEKSSDVFGQDRGQLQDARRGRDRGPGGLGRRRRETLQPQRGAGGAHRGREGGPRPSEGVPGGVRVAAGALASLRAPGGGGAGWPSLPRLLRLGFLLLSHPILLSPPCPHFPSPPPVGRPRREGPRAAAPRPPPRGRRAPPLRRARPLPAGRRRPAGDFGVLF
ncbi:unnamed protein product [Prorocentrum cordatum]|uniref:Protochlorophyllide reductase n=1 Tax=Prorocentrum cordatum TaxID=2364126 RepID=A0ABN9TK97_9DINO|nr:unnamed protein product [Polarella glacialis]